MGIAVEASASHRQKGSRAAFWRVAFTILAVGFLGLPARAVLTTFGTRNTAAPTGDLAASGWQYEGNISNFTGTPIAPNYFLTAKHLLIGGGAVFTYSGQTYHVVSVANDANSDISICKVDGTFSSYAPIYQASITDIGKPIMVYGRGGAAGTPIDVGGQVKGWQWGAPDTTLSWGQNTIKTVFNAGSSMGTMIAFTFDRGTTVAESQVVSGDSGGGVFINDNGTWKLAGLVSSAEALFSTDGVNGFYGAVFDKGGLFQKIGGTWTWIPNVAADAPSTAYITSISGHSDFINSVVGAQVLPEPGIAMAGLAAGLMLVRRRRIRAA